MTNALEWRVRMYGPASCPCDIRSWGLANRQRVALSVHLRFNMIAWANGSGHPGGCIGMHTHLITRHIA